MLAASDQPKGDNAEVVPAAPSARSELVHREGPTVQIRFPPPPSVGDDLGGGSNDPLGERGGALCRLSPRVMGWTPPDGICVPR
jgi:hypothetical protein